MAKQFIDLADLTLFKNLNDSATAEAIRVAEARSLHTVAIDGTTLKFYREEEPVGSATPAYSITLPQQDLSNYLQKIANATEGNVVIANADGTVADGNVALSALALSDDLADVATSGAAADVSIADEAGLIEATTVEGALAELAQASAGGVASKTVYVVESSGQTGDVYSKQYSIYQGATGSSASPVAGEKLVDINIPKDMFIESGSVGTVTTPDVPYEGAVVGDKYIDLVLANAESTHIYIPANRLVDIYTGGTTAEATVTIDNNNEITVTINKIAATKVIYAPADETQGTPEVTVKAKIDAVEAKVDAIDVSGDIDEAIAALDANVSIEDAQDENPLNITITEVDGVLTSVTGSIDANTFDTYGAATTVQNTITGSAQDDKDQITLYGIKAYADSVAGDATEAVPESAIRNLFNSPSI